MQGATYLIAAYIIAWIALFAYLAFIVMRLNSVRMELAAVEELVRESTAKEKGEVQES
ncbi:MAG: CcmD family protein [Ktedonobacteraceae bacterium]|nr:CcmD family protein [Ktedonobacteraceae bacterium]